MKLIIDIDESIYHRFINGFANENDAYLIEQIFKNSTLYEERSQSEWIPVTYRPVTEEERIELVECFGIEYCDTYPEKMLSCPLPEDGQEILVSHETYVSEDICAWDGCLCDLENNGDWDGITAWMPKPKPYKAGGEDKG